MIDKNQTKKTSARNGQSTRKGTVVRRLRVFNLLTICSLDEQATNMLKVVSNPGSRLYNQVCHSLIGFDARVQRYLVECVTLYFAGQAVTLTAFPFINSVLERLYKKVDKALAAGQ